MVYDQINRVYMNAMCPFIFGVLCPNSMFLGCSGSLVVVEKLRLRVDFS